ncbi:hypothetical protein HYDPIDRAFT_95380 [Hydnomerulius pinastri MD-312]|uniref:P-loop containing nucleoside triphosphate hydrolase protein n=1 Tax=Hydnomerulius pinastri MD-312 TaxID=994086 RepID=A0A0C9WCZ5_9AGAM|nr:hypothetical protein HYDPIDRAFT_95380 [Hydnomerulius pinastri MD-312]
MSELPSGSSSTPSDPFSEEQTVLILVGLIASGKSTFAEALETHFPRFRRCNQDNLGDRRSVEDLAYRTLREGLSPCIDRTNFNAVQRSYWTNIARAFPGTSICVIVFDTPYHVCVSRLKQRTSHPTIKNVQQGMSVLAKFASDLQLPSPDEDYDHIIYLRPSDQPRPKNTRDEIFSILQRLKASTRDTGTGDMQPRIQPYFGNRGTHYSRSAPTRGYRGGSGYRGAQSHAVHRHDASSLSQRGMERGGASGSVRSASRTRGSNSCDWRRSPHRGSFNEGNNRRISDQRSPASMSSTEGSKSTGPGSGSPDDPMIIS